MLKHRIHEVNDHKDCTMAKLNKCTNVHWTQLYKGEKISYTAQYTITGLVKAFYILLLIRPVESQTISTTLESMYKPLTCRTPLRIIRIIKQQVSNSWALS